MPTRWARKPNLRSYRIRTCHRDAPESKAPMAHGGFYSSCQALLIVQSNNKICFKVNLFTPKEVPKHELEGNSAQRITESRPDPTTPRLRRAWVLALRSLPSWKARTSEAWARCQVVTRALTINKSEAGLLPLPKLAQSS